MATHSSVLAWRIPGVGGAWWAAIYGVAQSRTRLKRLSSSSRASLVAQRLKHLPGMWETLLWFLSWEDTLEKEMATHSSTLAWRIPWREEPGRLQSMGSQSQTRLMDFTFLLIYRSLFNPLSVRVVCYTAINNMHLHIWNSFLSCNTKQIKINIKI